MVSERVINYKWLFTSPITTNKITVQITISTKYWITYYFVNPISISTS